MRKTTHSLLVVASFSRHPDALQWAAEQLTARHGAIAFTSPDFAFDQTKYYEATMGTGLRKRLLVFDALVPADCLPDVKRAAIALENELAASGRFPESRPLNLDPGLVQLGKFLLASTKDHAHRVYLRDGIFAEVTLRFQGGAFEFWPWTFADYREEAVLRVPESGESPSLREDHRAARAGIDGTIGHFLPLRHFAPASRPTSFLTTPSTSSHAPLAGRSSACYDLQTLKAAGIDIQMNRKRWRKNP